MHSPTSPIASSPQTPVSVSTLDFSSPSTPRTALSTTTSATVYTPQTPAFDDVTPLCTPLKRLSFSTPIQLDSPPFKRRKSSNTAVIYPSPPERRESQTTYQERPHYERKPSIAPYYPSDAFGTLTLDRPIASGQWSKVFFASSSSASHPQSRRGSARQVYAAKCGSGRSAQEVLKHEARILTHLRAVSPEYTDYIVGFHGYDLQYKAVILEYLPLTLEDWIQSLTPSSASSDSTVTERAIVKRLNEELLPMALHLVRGLAFLHEQGLVHGDIKPGNILLAPRASSSGDSGVSLHSGSAQDSIMYTPLFIDFTASTLSLPNLTINPPKSSGAGTYDFMPPELFSLSATPTTSADVYALGLTLLTAVLGHSPYDGAANVFMRRAMAMQGTPLEFASGDWQGWQRARALNVERWLGGAVRGKSAERWAVREWVSVLEGLVEARQ